MSESFLWWAFCASPPFRCLVLSFFLLACLPPSNVERPPLQLLRHVEQNSALRVQLSTEVQRDEQPLTQYSRAELLALKTAATRLSPHDNARLRSLHIGVDLPRKRSRRGGKRKQKERDTNKLKFVCFNCQSCRKVASDIHDLVKDENIDVLVLTETWLYSTGDEAHIAAMTPADYDFYSFPRTGSRGGGIGFIVRKSLSGFISFKQLDYTSFEAIELHLSKDQVSSNMICLYRPPPSARNKLSNSNFLQEFSELLSDYASSPNHISFLGDFNFHFDNCCDPSVNQLKTVLSDHNLIQLVNTPTHKHGHILDWVVVRSDESPLLFDHVQEYPGVSDHAAIFCTLNIRRPPPSRRTVTSRNIRAVNLPDFQSDVHRHMLPITELHADCPLQDLVSAYNNSLSQILDHHAPLKTRTVKDRPSAPWMTDDVRAARRRRRCAERQWRDTRLTVHRQIFVSERSAVKSVEQKARREYYCDQINSSPSCKQLFSVSCELLGKTKTMSVPTIFPSAELPQRFSQFFMDKIKLIRFKLDSCVCDPPTFSVYDGPTMSMFQPVTESFINQLIVKSPTKSCILDPIPTALTKQCLSDLVPLITAIVNASLSTGTVPQQFKEAVVTPLLKKPGLDPNELKNFRPVSNLPFISKILEKVVLFQLQKHLSDNGLLEMYQSAYRTDHSTETAVLSVLDGLLLKADERLVSLLALLDLSAAFDTLDHHILLQRLEITFGIRGTVLGWFVSYLSNRFQSVIVNGCQSDSNPLMYGVPQGSVLGPVLFTLYSQPLSDVIAQHNCDFHKYADDTELSKSSLPSDFVLVRNSIQICIDNVLSWMNSNKLKLNTDKTEVMPVGAPPHLRLIDSEYVTIGGSDISFQKSVKYLGVKIDQKLSMQEHIGNVCRASYLELRRLATIRPYLSKRACERLVSAFVTSRLDYCNSVLAALPAEQLSRLQRVQNNAARLIMKKRKREHVTPLLKELHWLPIKFRCQYKIACFAYRHFQGSLPSYLSACLSTYQTSRTLRSSKMKLLKVPKRNLKSFGERAFSFTAPSIWNSLPTDLRNLPNLHQFKSQLKTYLFTKAFL